MRRVLVSSIILALGFLFAGLPKAAVSGSLCANGDRGVAATVNQINSRGLEEARYPAHYAWDETFSPMAEWYTQFIVRLGSRTVPNDAEQRSIRALTNCLSRAGVHVANRIWLNSAETTYDPSRVRAGADAIDGSLVEREGGSNSDAQFDDDVAKWIADQSLSLPSLNPHNLVGEINDASHNLAHGDSNPFRTITIVTLRQDAEVETAYEKIGGVDPSTIWYYSDGGVQGVRFDTKSKQVSAFIFVGENEDIARMCGELSVQTWRAITDKFSLENAYVQPVELDVANNPMGFWLTTPLSYGTRLFGARGRAWLMLDKSTLALTALTGTSGVKGPLGGPLVSPRGFTAPFLSTKRSMLYVVQDMNTGVILFIGSHLNAGAKGN